jgi:hypothetical protein
MVTHRIVQLGGSKPPPKFERMVEEMGAQIARRVALVGDTNGLMFCAYGERKWMRKCLRAFFWRCSNKVEPVCCFRFFSYLL